MYDDIVVMWIPERLVLHLIYCFAFPGWWLFGSLALLRSQTPDIMRPARVKDSAGKVQQWQIIISFISYSKLAVRIP